MSLVVSMLDNKAMPLTTPEQPLYFVGRRHEAEESGEEQRKPGDASRALDAHDSLH